MATAKDLIVKPIKSSVANDFVKAHHYSGKVAQNSQLHLGVFLDNWLHGVMQFGPSLDKRKIQGLVSGTLWHEFLELNRMAFDEVLPRNSESRALAVAFRMIKKNAPQVKWIVSFADGTQCGDGTIYRAAGFVLTGIKENSELYHFPNGTVLHEIAMKTMRKEIADEVYKASNGKSSARHYVKAQGGEKLKGFQLRYIYFIDPAYRERLTVPELPYSEIERRGAKMYLGQKPGGTGETDNAAETNQQTGGARPTVPLSETSETSQIP
jgi:hypothetical protein